MVGETRWREGSDVYCHKENKTELHSGEDRELESLTANEDENWDHNGGLEPLNGGQGH